MKVLLKWKTVWRLQDIEKLHRQKWKKTASQIYEQTLIIFMSGHVAVENLANMTKWFFWQGKKEESSSKLIIPGRENCFVALNTIFITKKCNNQRKLYEHLNPVMHMGNIRKSFLITCTHSQDAVCFLLASPESDQVTARCEAEWGGGGGVKWTSLNLLLFIDQLLKTGAVKMNQNKATFSFGL